MAYTSPLGQKEVMIHVTKYKLFLLVTVDFSLIVFLMTILFQGWWHNKLFWTYGTLLTLISIIADRYFNIKKNSNKQYLQFDFNHFREPEKGVIVKWLKIEKYVSYLWILGVILLLVSKWCET